MTTAEILLYRALGRSIDGDWIRWAIGMLEKGDWDTAEKCLSSKLRHMLKAEMADRTFFDQYVVSGFGCKTRELIPANLTTEACLARLERSLCSRGRLTFLVGSGLATCTVVKEGDEWKLIIDPEWVKTREDYLNWYQRAIGTAGGKAQKLEGLPSETSGPNTNWTVWIADGKGAVGRTIDDKPGKEILDLYIETLRKASFWNVWGKERAQEVMASLKVTKIGMWESCEVYDITNHDAKHKSIVLKDSNGGYRILYTQFSGCTADVLDFPEIFELDGKSILSYHTRMPGTGNFAIEYYFIFDEGTKRPRRIDVYSPVAKELRRILPEGYNVWKGGGLIFKKMMYSALVWRKGDGNSGPSGGKVNMTLALRNGKLNVIGSKYTTE